MEEKILLILKDYQKEFVESKEKVVIGNFSRGAGKSFSLASKVLHEKPKYCYYVGNRGTCQWNDFVLKIKEIVDKTSGFYFIFNMNHLEITYMNTGEKTYIYNYAKMESDYMRGKRLPDEFDMVICDDCLPLYTIPSKKYISVVSMKYLSYVMYPNKDIKLVHCGIKELVGNEITDKSKLNNIRTMNIETFNREFDILSEYDEMFESKKEKTMIEIIDEQRLKMIKEFENCGKNQNETRKELLDMIMILNELKRNQRGRK